MTLNRDADEIWVETSSPVSGALQRQYIQIYTKYDEVKNDQKNIFKKNC